MAEENSGDLVRIEDFEGDLEEEWREARGNKVFDKDGEDIGSVEDLYVWAEAEAAHLIKADVDGRHVLIPADAVTTASEAGVEVEAAKDVILEAPVHDSDDVPDPETIRAAYDHYGYTDQLSLGSG